MNREIEMLQADGDRGLAVLFEENRSRLERMLEFRLDQRLRGRLDPDDVLQEAYVEAARRLHDYLARPAVSFYIWIRQITSQIMIDLQRRHFGKKRDPRQEVRSPVYHDPDATNLSIMSALFDNLTTPSEALVRIEERDAIQAFLQGMDDIDREVVALRHFEQLTNSQVAEALGISVTAASNRYVRAMMRLSQIAGKSAKTNDQTGGGHESV